MIFNIDPNLSLTFSILRKETERKLVKWVNCLKCLLIQFLISVLFWLSLKKTINVIHFNPDYLFCFFLWQKSDQINAVDDLSDAVIGEVLIFRFLFPFFFLDRILLKINRTFASKWIGIFNWTWLWTCW